MDRYRQLIAFAVVLFIIVMFPRLAHAGSYDDCYSLLSDSNGGECPDQGAASQGATAYANAFVSGFNSDPLNIRNKMTVSISGSSALPDYPRVGYTTIRVRVVYQTGDGALNAERYYLSANTCANRHSLTTTFSPKSGSTSCSDGCEQLWFKNADGTSTAQYVGTTCNTADYPNKCLKGSYWNAQLNVCEPMKDECPSGQQPNSVGKCAPEPCPDGMLQQQDGTCKSKESECPPAQVKGPDGSCVKKPDACPAAQAMGADGTCKPDKDGDGKPDDDDKDGDGKDDKSSFSGGDSCDFPPSCSGDPVMCGQARIQWRIDCNTRRNRNISGGACSTPPICTGDKCDAMEYASLLMQWRTACATEKLAAGKGTDNSGDQPAWTKVTGMSQDPGAGSSPDDTKVLTVNKISTDSLDQSGFGGGSCVGFGGGGSGAISKAISSTFATPPPIWCDYMAKLKAGLIVVASCVACIILARGAT